MLDANVERKQNELLAKMAEMRLKTSVVFFGSVGCYRKVALHKPVADFLEKENKLVKLGLTNEIDGGDIRMAGGSRCFLI